jgi:hypothetical protein
LRRSGLRRAGATAKSTRWSTNSVGRGPLSSRRATPPIV